MRGTGACVVPFSCRARGARVSFCKFPSAEALGCLMLRPRRWQDNVTAIGFTQSAAGPHLPDVGKCGELTAAYWRLFPTFLTTHAFHSSSFIVFAAARSTMAVSSASLHFNLRPFISR